MLSFFRLGREDYAHMFNYIVTMALTAGVMSVLASLLSKPLEMVLDFNPLTIFILVLLFLTTAALAFLFDRSQKASEKDPGHPRDPRTYEYGLYFSLAFFISITLKGCTEISSISSWVIVSAGFVPLVVGKFLNLPYYRLAHSRTRDSEPPTNERTSETGTQGIGIGTEVSGEELARLTLPAALEGRLNIQRHHLIVVIIIETILSLKKFVTQSEIFEASKRFRRGFLPSTFAETIQLLMFRFYQERKKQYKSIDINKDEKDNWILFDDSGPTPKSI